MFLFSAYAINPFSLIRLEFIYYSFSAKLLKYFSKWLYNFAFSTVIYEGCFISSLILGMVSLFYLAILKGVWGFLGASVIKNPLAKQETQVRSLGQEDPLEEEMTTHSSILA